MSHRFPRIDPGTQYLVLCRRTEAVRVFNDYVVVFLVDVEFCDFHCSKPQVLQKEKNWRPPEISFSLWQMELCIIIATILIVELEHSQFSPIRLCIFCHMFLRMRTAGNCLSAVITYRISGYVACCYIIPLYTSLIYFFSTCASEN